MKHNGFEVDFLWRELGLVVETDGLRSTARPPSSTGIVYATRLIRRPANAGRFTHGKVRHEPPTWSRSCAGS